MKKALTWLLAAAVALQSAAAFSCSCRCASKAHQSSGDVAREPATPQGCYCGHAVFSASGVHRSTSGERISTQGYQPCRCDGASACKGRCTATAAVPAVPSPRVETDDLSQAAACLFVYWDVVETDVRVAWNRADAPFIATPPDLCAHLCRWLL